ncbi:alpha/beta hydrolase [Staphylococcus sp. SQ8-PEA]|uniref:Alpha/beta hydrolase n=1 Tax=Staphylococcus marylandisciuri TaxID=2981529 RepID=A0ABT2QS31_9STAP|nr:alpha/beta hydrolase [Staphylococcus marylandisciuri]MCU5746782.1 alpha/beta hydrolase [Staphylococcus marylandisciuri]
MGNEIFYIRVSDGTQLEVQIDKAKIQTLGVIHIFHGMAEHFKRYNHLVKSLNEQGFDVIRHHHRGHGYDIAEEDRGHISSFKQVSEDAYEIIETLKGGYDDQLPYIILGHSMGSLIARTFANRHSRLIDGLILTGTPQLNPWLTRINLVFLKIITFIFGKKRCMQWLNNMIQKSFMKKIKNNSQPHSWLSSNAEEVQKYNEDPHSGFLVSNQLIYGMSAAMNQSVKIKNLKGIKSSLPILLINGKEDPVNKYGQGVRFLGKRLKRAGVEHVTVHMYKYRRHEILFEEGYENVWQHMLNWIDKRILRRR